MSLAPAFEIGLWNAWIFMGLFLLLPQIVLSRVYRRPFKRWSVDVPYNETEKMISKIWPLFLLLAIIYSFFLPLKLGTTWFYIGLAICLFATIMNAMIPVSNAATPPDMPFTKGPYRYSRHPLYVTQFLVFTGTGIACASWVFLLCTAGIIFPVGILAIPEERLCLEKYGDAYREYLDRTPRWMGLPKSGKK
jgi:protein-S-isoprenylcysteine O-methyltransferase Ste14